MSSQKKCSRCGKWTKGDSPDISFCSNCHHPFEKPAFVHSLERQSKTPEKNFFRIKPEDNFLMKAVRKTSFIAHVIFVAIMAWIIWVLILVAH